VEDDYYRILSEDGYRQISESDLKAGDLVLYEFLGGLQHVAVVCDIRLDGSVFVISQWGQVGEFTHRIDDVLEWLGEPFQYWTDREP
jgi:hypothetical protein